MSSLPRVAPRQTSRQLAWYFVIGLAQFAGDAALLYSMLRWGVAVEVANVASRASAGMAGFWLNRWITFGSTAEPWWPSFLRFGALWLAMTMLSSGLLSAAAWLLGRDADHAGLLTMAKLLIELALFVLAFLVSKLWVYRNAK
ncbi:GtrA family protein [Parachitinimonas caeni]|uniref:GtrA family protein n=1 Tax=Parachitinimonas caeni TaxID=3031301 RepID=A0ABT7DSZ3_9NEIS|nr:GtrA family protein [Parachitinimonas caeni]MDK2122904.1 GtrA family protein [Parachitinimonas caeni]